MTKHLALGHNPRSDVKQVVEEELAPLIGISPFQRLGGWTLHTAQKPKAQSPEVEEARHVDKPRQQSTSSRTHGTVR
jgi:hypothetical protein